MYLDSYNRPASEGIEVPPNKHAMAEGYSTGQIPGLSVGMKALDIQNKTQADTSNMCDGLLSLPNEVLIEMVKHLSPAHDTVQTGYPGSDDLRSAQAGLDALQALCRVSGRMQDVAKPELYRTIVVSDPYKLHRLRETLDKDPELGEGVRSLAVYRDFDESDDDDHTAKEFSKTLVAVLEKTPGLLILSLNFDKTSRFNNPRPFGLMKRNLEKYISRAKRAKIPEEFLPNVGTLGIILPEGEASEVQRSEEYEIFKDLLNLPSLRHIVVRRPKADHFTGRDIYGRLLRQRRQPLRHTITSVDLQVPRRMPWDDIGEITSMFPALSSLVLSHVSHDPTLREVAPGWSGPIRMAHLLHLSIDITSPEGWSYCEWFSDSIQSQFQFAPMLETLRIPLRLLRNPFEAGGLMLNPVEVLPRTLQSLILIADLKVFELYDPRGERIPPVEEYYFEDTIQLTYPIVCHLSVERTLEFLEAIEANSPDYFSDLKMLAIEYETCRLLNHPKADVINPILDNCEGFFVSGVQDLQETMSRKGIDVNLSRM